MWLFGSNNPVTRRIRRVLDQRRSVRQSRFYGTQRVRRRRADVAAPVTNVSVTARYMEDFTKDESVLSRDNLKI